MDDDFIYNSMLYEDSVDPTEEALELDRLHQPEYEENDEEKD